VGITRRHFIGGAALASAGAALWFSRHWPAPTQDDVLLSGFEDLPGNQYVGGLSLPDGRVFGHKVTARVHGNAIDPQRPQRVLYFARRPGTDVFELDLATMQVRTVFSTPAGRHLAGHGLFSADGAVLFTSEHEYDTPRGVLGIRDAHDFRVLGEIDTQGIDPHEIAWLPDGKTLVVANGGILTHPRTFREKLNIPTMDPSLVLIDVASGRCLEQLRLPDHLLSIRHLAVMRNGSVAVGLQYEGEPLDAPSVAALYQPGNGLRLLRAPENAKNQLHGYVASIATSESLGLIAAACPQGAGVARWSAATGEFVDFVASAEVYGVAAGHDGELLASQRDGTAFSMATRQSAHALSLHLPQPLRWDDHWSVAPHLVRQLLLPSFAG
jgi:uncharacterized protein